MKITITDATEAEYQQFWRALLDGEEALKARANDPNCRPTEKFDHPMMAIKSAMVLREAFESSDAWACLGNHGRVKR